MAPLPLLGSAAVAGVVTLAAARWLERRCPPLLRDRSARAQGLPRIGGLAILLGLLAASPLFPDLRLLLPIALATLLGVHDDATDSSALLRLLALGALATLGALLVGGPLPLPLAAGFALCVIVGFDFIDGLDGLACGLALCALAPLTPHSPLAAALLGATGTYLLASNRPPARSLLGDGGSNGLGMAVALALLATKPDPTGLPALALLAAIPLLDLGTTLLRRLRRRALLQSEQGHLHHRLALRWGQPGLAVLELLAVASLCALAASFALVGRPSLPLFSAAALALSLIAVRAATFRE